MKTKTVKQVVTAFKFQDFIDCRDRRTIHKALMDKFVMIVVSKRIWKERLKKPLTNIGELCSVSDEAFALLVLENGWDNWCDTHILHGGKFKRRPRKKKNNKRKLSALLDDESGGEEDEEEAANEEENKENKSNQEEQSKEVYPISKVPLKWTMHKNNDQASYFQWTNEGIKRFNTLYDIVKERRARQVAIDDAYLKSLNKAKVVQTKKLEGEMNLCRQDW